MKRPMRRSCKERPSTGILIELCDRCFEEFERRIDEHAGASGSYEPSDKELEFLADPLVIRRN